MMGADKKICWNCGNPIEYINVQIDGIIFCSRCGSKLYEPGGPKINLEDATKRRFDVLTKDPDELKLSIDNIPADLDDACKELYIALNTLSGIVTTGSCCGHGIQPYRFWFRIESLQAFGFLTLLRVIDPRYGCNESWIIHVEETDLSEAPVVFVLEAPPGNYESAITLARRLSEPNPGLFNWLNSCE